MDTQRLVVNVTPARIGQAEQQRTCVQVASVYSTIVVRREHLFVCVNPRIIPHFRSRPNPKLPPDNGRTQGATQECNSDAKMENKIQKIRRCPASGHRMQ
jgi:hypothetical protein